MAINRFYSLVFFILLSKLSISEASSDQKHDLLYPKLFPQLQALAQTIEYINQTFSEPDDIFDKRCTIKSCKFLNCYSEVVIEDHYGGAIYFTLSVSTITDSLFDNCAASQGGAIYSQETQITISNTNFTYNLALEAGGAVVFYRSENFKITGGFSMYNEAMIHGCFDVHESNGTIESHNFISNKVMYDTACISVYESQVTISKCYFIENKADIYPGALQIEEIEEALLPTSCIVKECYFISNDASGEPISININGNITGSITNCVFDVDIKEAIIVFRAPLFKIENNKFDPDVKNPFKIVENKQEVIEYSRIFDHTRSNYVAAVFLILIPLYVGIVFLILIKD